MNAWVIGSFVGMTAAVALVTTLWVRRLSSSADEAEEFFTGGRSLAWPVVAGSLLLTNLSTEQLVGLNGAVFGDQNLAGVAWEALAALAMVVTALVFLPRYMASGFTTTPAFLEARFDRATRTIVSVFFLVGYVTVLLPVILYTGSLALIGMFDLPLSLAAVSVGIGTLGSAYALVGGLKTVAVSDTLNAIGLLVGGLAIPVLALADLGGGSVGEGLQVLARERPASLSVLGGADDSVPWPTLLTGMMLIQVFYWSTNQVIVQRALGARSLADGQRGVLFAAAMKLVGPVMLCLPGIVALHMADLDIASNDAVYPAVVRRVLPQWAMGLFAAVLVGSILSSFNSALNSASTLFALEFYRPYRAPDATDALVVAVGRRFGLGIAIAAMIGAPLLAEAGGIFEYLQKVNGLYSVPIVSIFIVGAVQKRASARAAKWGMAVGFIAYGFFTFAATEAVHWLHGYAISFALATATIALHGRRHPAPPPAEGSSPPAPAGVDLQPWRSARTVSLGIAAAVFAMYATLSFLVH